MNAIIGLVFPIALTNFGGGNVFMFFAVMMIPFFFFVWKVMPETKGKSLEELEKIVVSKDENRYANSLFFHDIFLVN